MSKKNKFVTYGAQEIFSYESNNYVVVVGHDFFDSNGSYVFSKKQAITYYNKILSQVSKKLDSDNHKEKIKAITIIENLRIESLRIH